MYLYLYTHINDCMYCSGQIKIYYNMVNKMA